MSGSAKTGSGSQSADFSGFEIGSPVGRPRSVSEEETESSFTGEELRMLIEEAVALPDEPESSGSSEYSETDDSFKDLRSSPGSVTQRDVAREPTLSGVREQSEPELADDQLEYFDYPSYYDSWDSDSSYEFEVGPMTSDQIDRLPTFSADQELVDGGCAICIDGVEINKLMIRLECSHLYCSECIRRWFGIKSSCPVCRKKY